MLKELIIKNFTNKVFDLPLFYAFQDGIRFELSDEASPIKQFLTAFETSKPIIQKIINGNDNALICLRSRLEFPIFKNRQTIRSLYDAGVKFGRDRELWVEEITDPDLLDDENKGFWIYIAFNVKINFIENFIWCALSNDLGVIKPAPGVMVYIFNIKEKIAAFPYDARGMDVIGYNHLFLKSLYNQFKNNTFQYDEEKMRLAFKD